MICVKFDAEIMKYSEQCGFLLHTSRKLKFNIMFYSLGLFVLASGIVSGMDDAWSNDREWVKNVIHVGIKCFLCYFMIFLVFYNRICESVASGLQRGTTTSHSWGTQKPTTKSQFCFTLSAYVLVPHTP